MADAIVASEKQFQEYAEKLPAADKFTDDEVRAAKDQNVPPLDFQRIASPSRFVEQEGGAK